MPTTVKRLAFVDALKAVASQLIVLHHLAFYGPMSTVANDLAPEFFSWLSHNARVAVQVFLVIGGFLAAKALAPTGHLMERSPLALIRKRYFKLVLPYAAAVLLSILCAAIARILMDDDSIPDPPTGWQLLAHLTLLQGVLNFDSLSAGVWYIAIDFQLFSLFLLMLWLARGVGRGNIYTLTAAVALVTALALASLFAFNRDADWDNWALYFFAAYALGVLAYWATRSEEKTDWLLVMASVVGVALIVDFRSRIAVALLTALALGAAQRWHLIESFPRSALLAYLGKISYSVFLVHFSVILLVNAVFSRIAADNPAANALGIVLAWGASTGVGALFYRLVESRAGGWPASTRAALTHLRERWLAAGGKP